VQQQACGMVGCMWSLPLQIQINQGNMTASLRPTSWPVKTMKSKCNTYGIEETTLETSKTESDENKSNSPSIPDFQNRVSSFQAWVLSFENLLSFENPERACIFSWKHYTNLPTKTEITALDVW